MKDTIENYLSFLGFPIAIIVVCNIIVSLLFPITSPYTWIPGMLIYWLITFTVVYFDCRKRKISFTYYLKGTKVRFYLIILTLVVGCMPLPIFLFYFKLMNNTFFIVSWILIALINPFFEEIFWRGYMLNHSVKLPSFIKTVYSSSLFTLSHVFIWGVFSIAMHTPELLISVFIMGVVWSIIYQKSKSIVLPYVSHMLVDFFNLSVLAMMNMLPIAIPH